ncbi:ribonuclease H-like protein, partial [Coprinellus micaceus]
MVIPSQDDIRIGLGESPNNVGELVAILVAVQTHTDVKQIRIATDSQYAMDALTMHAEDWADDGFVDTKNGEIIKALLGEIQTAKAQVMIKKVKGHSGDRGNDGADALANEGARKEAVDEIKIDKAKMIGAAGGKLQTLSQALAYRALRLRIQEKM